jgi:hypothetical protein
MKQAWGRCKTNSLFLPENVKGTRPFGGLTD